MIVNICLTDGRHFIQWKWFVQKCKFILNLLNKIYWNNYEIFCRLSEYKRRFIQFYTLKVPLAISWILNFRTTLKRELDELQNVRPLIAIYDVHKTIVDAVYVLKYFFIYFFFWLIFFLFQNFHYSLISAAIKSKSHIEHHWIDLKYFFFF